MFHEGTILGHEITDDSQRKESDTDSHRHPRDDKRLHSFSTNFCHIIEIGKSSYTSETDYERGETEYKKYFEWLIEEINPPDIHSGLADMFSHISEQP